MDKLLDKIEKKLDLFNDKLHDIDKTLVRNTDSLEIHIRRTELLERDVAPIKAHVAKVEVIWRTLCWGGGLAVVVLGSVLSIYKVYHG